MPDHQYGWTTKIFPILPPGSGKGVLWQDAEEAHKSYALAGGPLGLEQLAERGGFPADEFAYFFRGLPLPEERPLPVKRCPSCKGCGDVVMSDHGGLVMKCGVCIGAGVVLPEGARR